MPVDPKSLSLYLDFSTVRELPIPVRIIPVDDGTVSQRPDLVIVVLLYILHAQTYMPYILLTSRYPR